MKNKKIVMRFWIVMAACMLGGGILGGVVAVFQTDIAQVASMLSRWIFVNVLPLQLICFAVLLALTVLFCLKSKRLQKNAAPDDEKAFEHMDRLLNIALTLTGINMIISLLCFGIATSQGLESFSAKPAWLALLIVLTAVFTCIFCEGKIVKMVKELYPEKRGNVLDFRFGKEWLASCDEAEKYVIYAAAYRSYLALQRAFAFAMALLILCSILFEVGILPFLVVSALWTIQTITYVSAATKLSRGKIS